jgi:hypothetical protein
MRSLLVLLLLVALGVGGFLSKPGIEAHRKHATEELAKASGEGDAIGDLIGSVFSNRSDSFEDLVVATKLTTKEGDTAVLECWGVFSQFFCSKPASESAGK